MLSSIIDRLKFAAAMTLALLAAPLAAQLLPGAEEETETATAPSPDPFGRETPRGAVDGLLAALSLQDYERAGQYLSPPIADDNTSDAAEEEEAPTPDPEASANEEMAEGEVSEVTELPSGPSENALLARNLQVLLDRAGRLTPSNQLSASPDGAVNDGLPLDIERVGRFTGEEEIPILFARSADETGTLVWRLSRQTISDFDKVVPPEVQEKLVEEVEQTSQQFMIAGAPLRDWLVLIGGAITSFAAFWLISTGLLLVLQRFVSDQEKSALYRLSFALLPPLSLFLMVVSFGYWSNSIDASIVARSALRNLNGVFGWIAVVWFALRLVDAIGRLIAARMGELEQRQTQSVVHLVQRAAKVVLLAFGAVVILDTLGVDVTTGIAALGIGGLAFALGAQKLIENLVGGVSVIADKPVQVGDFCRVGGVSGTVEDIGIRSTRLRTLDRTLLTIPNAAFASEQIENYAVRDRFLFNPVIGLEYGTSAEGLRDAKSIIEDVLSAHEKVDDETTRVLFSDFSASSLDITVYTYILTTDFVESLHLRHELLLAIHERLGRAGYSMAFPTTTVHMAPGNSAMAET
ncbi:MAG: mechanosensitive ion channel family protein [Pseudomonadota bacterium]